MTGTKNSKEAEVRDDSKELIELRRKYHDLTIRYNAKLDSERMYQARLANEIANNTNLSVQNKYLLQKLDNVLNSDDLEEAKLAAYYDE